ncbi:FMN-dependent alpha-hydroxy acid dehydrogenase [Sarocladium strictum]
MDNKTTRPINVAEVKKIAEQVLQKPVWRYYVDGADEQLTTAQNERVYKQVLIRPRVLRDVSSIDMKTTVFGKTYDSPIAISPSAYQKLVGHGGEIDVARAAFTKGTNFILSSNATTSLEDVATGLSPRQDGYPMPWFQLYYVDSHYEELIRRAEDAGYEALVLTVDTVVMGNRLHERKEPLKLPPGLSLANMKSRKSTGSSKGRLILNAETAAEAAKIAKKYASELTATDLTWEKTIPLLRSKTKLKIILKGILTAEDALKAVEAGVDGIMVSNHGGRQLDGVPATLEALPEIVDAVRGRVPILFDGGITHGADVFKALALGADLCFLGRSALWGLAYDGQKGVETVLNILERELWRTMALSGARSIKDITRSMLGVRRTDGFGVARL